MMRAPIIIVALIAAGLVFLGGYIAGQAYTRADAVQAGAGNYTADGKVWRWK